MLTAAITGAAISPATLVNIPFSLFIPALEDEFGWSRTQITGALSTFIVLLILALPLAGRLVDRFGARRIAVPSILLYGLAIASSAWLSGSILHLYAIYGLIAVLGAGAQSLTFIKVLSVWFDRRRGLAIGACMAGFGLGYVLVPLFTRALIGAWGWRAAYAGLGALAVLGALPVIAMLLHDSPAACGLAMRDARPVSATPVRSTPVRAAAVRAADLTLLESARTREFWLLAISFVLMSAALNGVQSQWAALLRDRGMDAAAAAYLLSAIGLGTFPGRLLVGFLIDRVFAPWVAILCYAVSAVALFWLVTGRSPAGTFLCALAIGLSLGAENDILGYLVGRYFGLRRFGQIYGALFSAYLVGAAAGPFLTAHARQVSASYAGALRIGACGVCAACALLAFLRRYRIPGEMT
ncbi:MAG TPA: MFS transporter [Steroidobacteraceae bacterium]|nr:MFS transporter [Steroidobacteraceae bacterium]